ncbi:SsrA-binding protein SmpB [Candidatus Daviesbacteria bacterium]|nr:SsrA-binding protein SmpB [Candidatus Daviesbacteria bacterium]
MRFINKRGLHNFHITDRLEAGLVLTGSEVKSVRAGRLDLSLSHIKVIQGEAFLVNANIPRFKQTSDKEYDPFRLRKLLLHRAQIDALIGKASATGFTLIPVSIYDKNNRFKVEIGVAKSKKDFDKRKALKEKDQLRRIEQELRGEKV